MTPEEKKEIYDAGFKSGQNHFSPSQETLRFMEEQLQINRDNTKEHAEIKELVVEVKTIVSGIHEQTKLTNGRVNKLDEFLPMLGDIKEERRYTKKKIFDLAWKAALFVVLASMGIQNIDKVIALFN